MVVVAAAALELEEPHLMMMMNHLLPLEEKLEVEASVQLQLMTMLLHLMSQMPEVEIPLLQFPHRCCSLPVVGRLHRELSEGASLPQAGQRAHRLTQVHNRYPHHCHRSTEVV